MKFSQYYGKTNLLLQLCINSTKYFNTPARLFVHVLHNHFCAYYYT